MLFQYTDTFNYHPIFNIDDPVKNTETVIPAKAGIHNILKRLD